MLFTKKAEEEKTKQHHVALIRTPNSKYQTSDGTALATCTSSCDDAVLGSLVMLVARKLKPDTGEQV